MLQKKSKNDITGKRSVPKREMAKPKRIPTNLENTNKSKNRFGFFFSR